MSVLGPSRNVRNWRFCPGERLAILAHLDRSKETPTLLVSDLREIFFQAGVKVSHWCHLWIGIGSANAVLG